MTIMTLTMLQVLHDIVRLWVVVVVKSRYSLTMLLFFWRRTLSLCSSSNSKKIVVRIRVLVVDDAEVLLPNFCKIVLIPSVNTTTKMKRE